MKWISVKDQLPDFDKEVLATDGEYCWVAERWLGKYNIEHFDSTICTCCNMESTYEVKYWMPIPEKPNEVG